MVADVSGLITTDCVTVVGGAVIGDSVTVDVSIFTELDACVTDGTVEADCKALMCTVELGDIGGIIVAVDFSIIDVLDTCAKDVDVD